MRARFVLIVLFGLAAVMVPSTARAGQGTSMWCNDGFSLGGTLVPVIDDPVTLNAEIGTAPAFVELCYSTTPRGHNAPAITGGRVYVTPSGTVCTSDTSPVVVALDCSIGGPTAPGGVVTLRVQHVILDVGATTNGVRSPLCIDDLRIYLPTTTLGPFDVGVC